MFKSLKKLFSTNRESSENYDFKLTNLIIDALHKTDILDKISLSPYQTVELKTSVGTIRYKISDSGNHIEYLYLDGKYVFLPYNLKKQIIKHHIELWRKYSEIRRKKYECKRKLEQESYLKNKFGGAN